MSEQARALHGIPDVLLMPLHKVHAKRVKHVRKLVVRQSPPEVGRVQLDASDVLHHAVREFAVSVTFFLVNKRAECREF